MRVRVWQMGLVLSMMAKVQWASGGHKRAGVGKGANEGAHEIVKRVVQGLGAKAKY